MQCATHPETQAAHTCSRCGCALCTACIKTSVVAGREAVSARLSTCQRCGGLVQSLPVALRTTERQDLRELVRRPFEPESLLTVLALSLPWWLTALPSIRLAMLGRLVYASALSAYYFQTIDHVGRGDKGLPFSSDITRVGEMFSALGRGLIVCTIAVGPALFWANFGNGSGFLTFLLLAFGMSCAPAAVLSIVLTRNAWNGLWPLVWAQVIARAPAAYARLVAVYLASTVAWVIGNSAAWFFLAPIPLFGILLSGLINTTLTLVQAVLVGGYLRRNAALFGQG